MKLPWPMIIIGSAFLLALLLLYFHRAKAWYLHVLSLALAAPLMFIPRASMPLPPAGENRFVDLTELSVIVFLVIWGLAAPFFRGPRGRRAA